MLVRPETFIGGTLGKVIRDPIYARDNPKHKVPAYIILTETGESTAP